MLKLKACMHVAHIPVLMQLPFALSKLCIARLVRPKAGETVTKVHVLTLERPKAGETATKVHNSNTNNNKITTTTTTATRTTRASPIKPEVNPLAEAPHEPSARHHLPAAS
ncbi:unnamed protein product [Polarella glacialis]|uniref:Uncharacterized protein n=1 Tax=Polarella glacialis TaxID=89957 RepID=A0A813JUQ2_POLGL|nr:unnamed protein product [Polarella glacialis]